MTFLVIICSSKPIWQVPRRAIRKEIGPNSFSAVVSDVFRPHFAWKSVEGRSVKVI